MRNRVYKYRIQRGLTQKELAILAQLNYQSVISGIELEKLTPTFKTMRKIAKVFRVPVERLFYD